MDFDGWIAWAKERGASDLHLEPGLPATLRAGGELQPVGERVSAGALNALARELLGDGRWDEFVERCSADLSRTSNGVRCRVNVLRSARGVGLAVRLLNSPAVTLRRLNLHPSLSRFAQATNGLVLVSGPTGSGKTSTAAALLQEINLKESRHVITLESPIEYALAPRRSLIRQREVGRDTPSFAQGLFDAMREDPDVLLVGEMREPEVMRLTLNAAETGHLVLATLHSSTVAEALQRVVAAFPAEIQPGICAQLADSLVGVIAQRLVNRRDLGLRVPECEVLTASTGVRALIRQGQFFKLPTALESGAADGCWSLARYRGWLDSKTDWVRPADSLPDEPSPEPLEDAEPLERPHPRAAAPTRAAPAARPAPKPLEPKVRPEPPARPETVENGVLVLDGEPDDLSSLMQELERRPGRK